MQKRIIVPTDFSENAYQAALYACQIATQNDFVVHLFHCYTSKTAIDDQELNIPKGDVLIQKLSINLKSQFTDISISTECVSRLLNDVLPEYAIEPHYSLIVMGTKGNTKNSLIIWGSNTSYITSKAKIPVIAVPEVTSTFKTDKVAILTNFKAEEIETLNEFVKNVNAIQTLDIIHIYKENKKTSDIEQQLKDWSFNIEQLSAIEKVNIIARPIQSQNEDLDTIPEVINAIISENDYDIVLVTKKRKTFFERIISTSVSKQITLTLQKPTFLDNN